MDNRIRQSSTNRSWVTLQTEAAIVAQLMSALNIGEPVATILAQRGFHDPIKAREFLYPSLQNLPSPFLMKGMQEAVEIIYQGVVVEHKPLIVFGDYDVDGVTATAVLLRFMGELGVNCHSCHPDRFKNGYGLKAALVEEIELERPGVVITVDCGISDFDQVERLVQNGWQVIVTDHHQPPDTLPKAHAVINPWQAGCQFPTKDLAGVGVSFYLVMGLRNYFQQKGYWGPSQAPPILKKNLDLVAVGTISDMVPLTYMNRLLTKAGLEVLTNTENAGLRELLDLCHIPRGQALNPDDISFQIGPRLNAAGRMGDAKRASTLLASKDKQLIKELARTIEQENIARRELTSQLAFEAIRMVKEHADPSLPCLVVHNQDWHLGLLGIVSSRLVDLYGKPVIVFGGAGILKGSARSTPGINIHEMIAACAEVVLEYGGHSSAAGLSIQEEMLPFFIKLVNDRIEEQLRRQDLPPVSFSIDYVVTENTGLEDLEAVGALLAPFGQGNPEPIFATSTPCRLRNMQVVGKEKNHLRFAAYLAGRWWDGIGFGFADSIRKGVHGEAMLTIVFTIKGNRFNGKIKPQILLSDIIL